MRSAHAVGAVGVLSLAVTGGCFMDLLGTGEGNTSSGGGGAGTGASAPAGGGGAGPTTSTMPGTGGDGNSGGSGGSGGGPCVPTLAAAVPAPLDLLLVLDHTSSMLDPPAPTRWERLQSGIQAYLADGGSAGIGLGALTFPAFNPAAPSSCTSSAQCGGFGPCRLKVCSGASWAACNTDPDCGASGPCVGLGDCAVSGTGCYPSGAICTDNQGACVQVTTSTCVGGDSCAAEDYALAYPLDATPSGPALAAAMNAVTFDGYGTQPAALEAAMQATKAWVDADPTREVAVVFVSDGIHFLCGDVGQAVNAVSGPASAAVRTRTYVLALDPGIDPQLPVQLSQVAAAGGTGSAKVLNAGTSTPTDVKDFLLQVVARASSCEYRAPLKPETVNLYYDQGDGAPEQLNYVASAAACDPATGGWYYDVTPPGTPSMIVLCPATCDNVSVDGAITVESGCGMK